MPIRIDLSNQRDIRDFRLGTSGGREIHALGGDDYVIGSEFADVIYGDGGGDDLYGAGADDIVYGGAGDDELHGGEGNDALVGGEGWDDLYGEGGDDRLWGEGGKDELFGGDGNDQLVGGADTDNLFGGRGDDWLWGGEVWDSLFGGDGNDRLFGQGGTDGLWGGNGEDQLYGGSENDTLLGGPGADRLEGGSGADHFAFRPIDLVTKTVNWGRFSFTYETIETDSVTDFELNGGDRLDLRDLMRAATSFAGTSTADAIAQGYVYWVQHGNPGDAGFGTTVYVDRNGVATDLLTRPDLAVADVLGVADYQLNASHFLV